MKTESFTAVVLAAGKGSRMKMEKHKLMLCLAGKALLLHVLENLHDAGCHNCVLVLGHYYEEIESFAKKESPIKNTEFVLQKEQLGTGHALLCAEELLSKREGPFIVTAGDMPLLSRYSFQTLLRHHNKGKNIATVLTANMRDPYNYGRICKDAKGQIEKIVEEKDASPKERKIQEVNTGTYVLESPRVFPLLREVNSQNAQREYYLPDLIAISRKKGYAIDSLCLRDPLEGKGVNTLAELEALEKLLQYRQLKPFSAKESSLSQAPMTKGKKWMLYLRNWALAFKKRNAHIGSKSNFA